VSQNQNTPKVACVQGESTLKDSIFIPIPELRVEEGETYFKASHVTGVNF
jgi:hypothetical protein